MKKRWLVITALLLAHVTSQSHGINLLETYRLAKKNDAQWKASQAAYKADKEVTEQGKAGLQPIVNFKASFAKATYESDTPNFGGDLFEDCGSEIGPGAEGIETINCYLDILNGGGTSSTTKSSYNTDSYSLSLQQPLFRLDRWYDYKKSKKMGSKAKHDLEHEKQALIVRTSQAYFNVLQAQEDLEFARNEELSIKKQLELAKDRYGLGLVRETDVYDAQAAYDIAKANYLFAETAFAVQRHNLEVLTGEPVTQLAILKKSMPVEQPKPEDASEWIKQAIANNPSLRSAIAAQRATRDEYRKQKSGHYPTMNFFASYTDTNTSGGSGFTPGSRSKIYGLDFNLPLYQGGFTSSSIRSASYRMQESKDRVQFQRLQIESQVQNLHLTVKADVHRIKARKLAIDSNQKSLDATQKSWTRGTRTIVDLFQAQRTLLAARRDYASARYDYIINSLKLKQMTGILKEEDIAALNSWLIN